MQIRPFPAQELIIVMSRIVRYWERFAVGIASSGSTPNFVIAHAGGFSRAVDLQTLPGASVASIN